MKRKSKLHGRTRRRLTAVPRNEREVQARVRAFAALARMRREGASLAAASRLEHIKPATVVRHVGSAIRQDNTGGRYHATKGDRFRRDLQIPTAQGRITIPVYGSKNAENISKYLNAVSHFLRTGDETRLRKFKGKTLKVGKQRIKLVTDINQLMRLAEADALRLDQLYAARKG